MYKLYIGNKNYSSWSMRPWVLMRQAGIPFQEVMVRFDSFEPGSAFKQGVAALPGVQAWVAGALAERDFLAFEEPYRLGPDPA